MSNQAGTIGIWRNETGEVVVRVSKKEQTFKIDDTDGIMERVKSGLEMLPLSISVTKPDDAASTDDIILDLQRQIAERDSLIQELQAGQK